MKLFEDKSKNAQRLMEIEMLEITISYRNKATWTRVETKRSD